MAQAGVPSAFRGLAKIGAAHGGMHEQYKYLKEVVKPQDVDEWVRKDAFMMIFFFLCTGYMLSDRMCCAHACFSFTFATLHY